MKFNSFSEQAQFIGEKAAAAKDMLLKPVIDESSGKFIDDPKVRHERLGSVAPHTIFESLGKGAPTVLATASNALRDYVSRHGMPPDDLLASNLYAMENLISLTAGDKKGPGIFESASDLSTTEGVLMRDRMVALVLPVTLMSITSQMVNFIPGNFNQSEIFKIKRIAASTFGDLDKGDEITWTFNGQYSSMDQRKQMNDGDGTEVGGAASTTANYFMLDSVAAFGAVMPIKKKSVKVYYEHTMVAKDDGDGNLAGSFTNDADAATTVTGTVDYALGKVNPIFSVAPEATKEIHIAVDIDIEKDPTLIPLVNMEMEAKQLYPHECAISGDTTLQALWAMRREFSIDINSQLMVQMRNLLSADKDRKHLSDMRFFSKGSTDWVYAVPDGVTARDHYQTLKKTLLSIDATLSDRTGGDGLAGIVADPASAVIMKFMRAPDFVPAPGYRRLPQPHYCGRLFGMWDVFEDPQAPTTYSSLCYAKGRELGRSGYVVGDAIPAITFRHDIQRDLTYKNTLWNLAYRDLNPFDGRNYFHTLTMSAS